MTGSEEEKRLVQDTPNLLKDIQSEVNDICRKLKCIALQIDQLHCNMKPFDIDNIKPLKTGWKH